MRYFKCEIVTRTGRKLATRYNVHERNGLEWCRKYIRDYRKDFPDEVLKVHVYQREETKGKPWEDYGKPYNFKRTLISKPKTKKTV